MKSRADPDKAEVRELKAKIRDYERVVDGLSQKLLVLQRDYAALDLENEILRARLKNDS